MKRITLTIASTLFLASAASADVYHGFANGNLDLYSEDSRTESNITGVQPGVGDGTSVYGSFKRNNLDLFSGSPVGGSSGGEHSDLYGGFRNGNPDLW